VFAVDDVVSVDCQGVTIPSQIRYVQYYGQIIRDKLQYEAVVLLLCAVELESVPTFSGGACSEYFHRWKLAACVGE